MNVLAWHFAAVSGLRDGRPLPPDGETLRHTGELVMCETGLHASKRLIDALQYAPGPIVCRVECGGTIKHDADKLVCSERTILWRADATDLLRSFARQCALDVAHLWEMPAIVRQYLETGDETIRAAASAAASAATSAAARAAASAATSAAARAATSAAARAAARAAASAATSAAASAATSAAARAAAWDAAWAAAWAAASAAQNDRLTAMVEAMRRSGTL